jgi:hypothetical protein
MIKKFLKKIIPSKNLNIYYNSKTRKKFESKKIKEIFKEIYLQQLWRPENERKNFDYYSGIGSYDSELINDYVESVKNFLLTFKNKPNVVDLGCGDFNVGLKLRKYCKNYIASDIVDELIDHNKKKFKQYNVDFRVLDITKNELPEAEICFLRQVLQHLSNSSILCFIGLLKKKYKYILITEHFPNTAKFISNIDKSDGPDIRIYQNSAVVLTAPPFNLKVVKEKTICETRSKKILNFEGHLKTTLLQLFN